MGWFIGVNPYATNKATTALNTHATIKLDSGKTIPTLSFEWQIAKKHKLGVRWQDINRDSTAQALTEIQWGDEIIPVDAAVTLGDPADHRGVVAGRPDNGVDLKKYPISMGPLLKFDPKKEVFPDFALDQVRVSVAYPGASPEEVEQGIVLAVEEAINGGEGVDEIRSTASEGRGLVIAELMEGADIQQANQDIQQEVDRITTFPVDAEEPEVNLSMHRRLVQSIVVYGEASEWVLRELTEQLRDRLLQQPGITQVDLVAARDYLREWERYEALPASRRQRTEPPRRDLQLDAIADFEGLDGDLLDAAARLESSHHEAPIFIIRPVGAIHTHLGAERLPLAAPEPELVVQEAKVERCVVDDQLRALDIGDEVLGHVRKARLVAQELVGDAVHFHRALIDLPVRL